MTTIRRTRNRPSSPTVSNRVSRLEDLGVIQGFTVEIDRSKLVTGDSVIIDIETYPGQTDVVVESLADNDSVECILQAFEPRVTVHAFLDDQEFEALFDEEGITNTAADCKGRICVEWFSSVVCRCPVRFLVSSDDRE